MGISKSVLERCVELAREFGATRLLVFGSAAQSPETARDVDLACEGVEGWRLFELGARLEEEVGLPVDLVPLRPDDRFSRYIATKARVIYEQS